LVSFHRCVGLSNSTPFFWWVGSSSECAALYYARHAGATAYFTLRVFRWKRDLIRFRHHLDRLGRFVADAAGKKRRWAL